MTMHAAKGLEFPTVVIAGLEEGLFPHSRATEEEEDIEEERRLCYVAMTRARARLVLTGAARRRVFGEYQATQPSRFLDEVPAALVDRLTPAYPSTMSQTNFAHYEFRTNPYGRKGKGRWREDESTYSYENEDQSVVELRAGMRVRHAQFGIGTVIAVEPHNDDMKITVRFADIGQKKLLAKYAKLQRA
jgi:DNA helicase-2/ATP-dependent DNA helicase PcrA